MAKQITVWEAEDGTRFDSAEEAARHDAAIHLRNDIYEFLISRDVITGRANAHAVARIISQNIDWFRTRLDAAAGEMKAGVWVARTAAQKG